jgi:hypothetical protein
MESPDVSPECKAELLWRRAGYNPIELNRRLNETVGQRLETNREKSMVKKPPVRRMAGPRGLISAGFLLLGGRLVSTGLIMRQRDYLTQYRK